MMTLNNMAMLNKRVRTIGLILWCDNPNHLLALDYIKHNFENYIYILHDRDIKEDNTLKKEHYHVILRFNNQKSISTLVKKLNVEDNCFYIIKSLTGQLRYLIHYDDDDKFQYDVSDVRGTLYMLSKFKQSLKSSQDELSEVSMIYEFIEVNKINDLHILLEFVLENNLYSSFRRNYTMFKDLMFLNGKEKFNDYYQKNRRN